ncbi:hypothetical protein ALNOE001_17260 [Candidatus Methanobinarius endosymbioticus]|uniref:Uncharacterized protein n=1 Tax=Candidatus Methanobinarius endosymbioticus TaxID=2006182 RepID=A0A366MAK1_9EURY|nr:hypothetical protein ALNOE001_17260 [Candidatus Methanobinarius endosymbioticus]
MDQGTYKGNNNKKLIIDKNLTIIGNGPKDSIIIDGENIATGTGSANRTSRGVIYSSGDNMIIISFNFIANQANEGGAIYISKGNVTINDNKFTNNG